MSAVLDALCRPRRFSEVSLVRTTRFEAECFKSFTTLLSRLFSTPCHVFLAWAKTTLSVQS